MVKTTTKKNAHPEHQQLLREHHDAADRDRGGVHRGGERHVVSALSGPPEEARDPLDEEGEADGREHHRERRGLDEGPVDGAVAEDSEQESADHRDGERHEVRHPQDDEERVSDEAAEHEELAVREVDVAGRAVHEHEPDRDHRVERAGRDSACNEIGEHHAVPRRTPAGEAAAPAEPATGAPPPGTGSGRLASGASAARGDPQRVTAVTPTRLVTPSTRPNQAAVLWHWWLVGVHVIGPA